MSAPFKRADKIARLRCAKNAVSGELPLPDTTDIAIVRLTEAVHNPIGETHAPRAIWII